MFRIPIIGCAAVLPVLGTGWPWLTVGRSERIPVLGAAVTSRWYCCSNVLYLALLVTRTL